MPQLRSKSGDLATLELIARTMSAEIRDMVRVAQAIEESIGVRHRDDPVDKSCVEDHLGLLCHIMVAPMVQSGNAALCDILELADILEKGADATRVFAAMVRHIDPDTRQAIVDAVLKEAADQPSDARLRELQTHAVIHGIRRALSSNKSSALERFDLLMRMVGMGNAGIGIFSDANRKIHFDQWRPGNEHLRAVS
jgi:hypothetical protein